MPFANGTRVITADNGSSLRDYHHRLAEPQQQPQDVRIVAGNVAPAAGPEVQDSRPMASPALQQLQQPPDGTGLVSVSSQKSRKIQAVLCNRSVLEKWLCFTVVVLTFGFAGMAMVKYPNGNSSDLCVTDECLKSAVSMMSSIKSNVEPCDDFYEYACGRWPYNHPSESGKINSWFSERTKNLNTKITELLEEEEDITNDLKSLVQAKRHYRSCMDTERIDSLGYELLFKYLKKFALPRTFPDFTTAIYANGIVFDVARSLGLIQRYFSLDLMIGITLQPPGPHNNQSTLIFGPAMMYIPTFPDPLVDYHRKSYGDQKSPNYNAFSDDLANTKDVLAKIDYMVHIIMLLLPDESLNQTTLSEDCLAILAFEEKLRFLNEAKEETTHEFFTIRDLETYMNSNTSRLFDADRMFSWQSFIHHFTMESNCTINLDNDKVLVRDQHYFIKLQQLLKESSIETIQQFMWWKVVETFIPHMTTEIIDLKSKFHHTVFPMLRIRPRPEFCTEVVRFYAKLAIAHKFYLRDEMSDTTAKVRMMTSQLQEAFKSMISDSMWTDDETEKVTTLKINALKVRVGFPELFKTPEIVEKKYERYQIKEDEYLGSMLNMKAEEVREALNMVGKAENVIFDLETLKAFSMDPLDVNAFYNRQDNSINIPAGILQMPFFYKGVDIVNYGAIGAILGHEITHGFDIEGKNYDVNGNNVSGWTQQTEMEYLTRAQCFVDQYQKFQLDDKHFVNGTQTLGENMADNIGLKQAWKAYKMHHVGEGFHLPGLDDLSNDQLFFLSYANVWCEKQENMNQSSLYLNDVHSPSKVRVLGTLRNSKEFSDVFKCSTGSLMNPLDKCSMW